LARVQRLPWHRIPELDRTRDHGHGRAEIRTLEAVSLHHLGFPDAAQVLQVTRKTASWTPAAVQDRDRLRHHQPHLPARQPRPVVGDLLRGQWGIGALPHVRGTTFGAGASQVRSGSGPQVMATFRNLVVGALRQAGWVNAAAALRHHARDPARPLATLGTTLGSSQARPGARRARRS
jgi:hypothetical protein